MVQAHDERRARALLEAALGLLGLNGAQLRALPKGDVRKQALGWCLQRQTTMKQAWVCERLHLGSRTTLHRATHRFNTAPPDPEVQRLKQLLQQLTI